MTAGSGWEYDETRTRGLALDQLAEELERIADEGETPDREALARRFGVQLSDVDRCQAAVGALGVFGKLAPPPPTPDQLGSGSGSGLREVQDTLGGYQLRGELARGGMGAVYRAWHPGLQKEVALKVLLAGKGASPKQLERFRIEGRAAARLRHPHIVPVHDIAQDQGYPFLILDLVEGESLAERVERDGPLPQRDAARIGQRLAEALHYAHGQLILHRDLKPGNVLLDERGEPLLTDFGLAKLLDHGDEDGLTQSGQVLGTVPFMAPEQASGGLIDQRADVYGLGATLYALLTGRPPFTGEQMFDVLKQVAADDPTPPSKLRPDLEAELETIVLTCLEKDPARRYATARALGEDLRRWLDHEPIQARPPRWRDRAAKWVRRNPVAFRALLIGLIALVVAGTGVGAWATRVQRQQRQALIDEARAGAEAALKELTWIGDKKDDAPIGRALAALHATQRWRDLAPDDPEAAKALYKAALSLGDRAQEREQWALAAQAYRLGRGLGNVDDEERLAARIRRVGTLRAAEAKRRTRVVTGVLDDAASGKLRRERLGLDDGVDAIVALGDRETVAQLCTRLDAIAREAWDVRAALLLEGLPELRRAGLSDRLERRWQVPPHHRLKDTEQVLARAVAEFVTKQRARGERRTFRRIVADGQRDALGAKLDAAEVACRALGRIGVRTPSAIRALSHYLLAEADPARAVAAGLALCRLGGPEAFGIVSWARRVHGPRGLFGTRIGRALSRFKDEDLVAGKQPSDYLSRAEARREKGDLKRALEDVEAGLALDDREPRLWLERARLRSLGGDHAAALEDLDRAIALRPKQALLRVARGDVLCRQKAWLKARGAFEDALRLDPNLAVAWVGKGLARRMLDALDGSERDYTRALQLEPSLPQAWQGRGQTRLAQRRYGQAMADVERALILDPDRLGALVLKGNLELVQRQAQRAAATFTRVLQIDPRSTVGLRNRCIARYLLRDYRGALADLVRLRELVPDDPQAWLRTGDVLTRLERLDEADAAYTKLIALRPKDSTGLRLRGALRLERSDPRGARDLEAALRLDPQDAKAALYLARLHRQRDPTRARRLAEQAVRTARAAQTKAEAAALLKQLKE